MYMGQDLENKVNKIFLGGMLSGMGTLGIGIGLHNYLSPNNSQSSYFDGPSTLIIQGLVVGISGLFYSIYQTRK
jgi:predicted phage tail protein